MPLIGCFAIKYFRMKKLLLIIVAVMTSVIGATGQEASAVLTHGTTTKTFSGYNALRNAYKEAASGDLITLSSGSFRAVDTVKVAVTIRGAGMETDTVYHTQPTLLVGNIVLDMSSTEQNHFQLEGVCHSGEACLYYRSNVKNAKFIKCRLYSIRAATYKNGDTLYGYTIKDATFMHCRIVKEVTCWSNSSMTFINCYVRHPQTWNSVSSAMNFRNCVVWPSYDTDAQQSSASSSTYGNYSHLYGATLVNSIIVKKNYSGYPYYINENTSFNYCLFYPEYHKDKNNAISYNNWYNDDLTKIFTSFTGTYSDAQDFYLTTSIKNTCKDEFGREIGLYGGSFPYSPRVAGPHIKQMQVSPRSTGDGKLNVKMKIENTGY